MGFESLSSGMNETKSTQGDSGNTMKFDPDKRIDVNDNRSSFVDNNISGFNPDKRIDTNDNRISELGNETKFSPDKRVDSDMSKIAYINDVTKEDLKETAKINIPNEYNSLDTMKQELGEAFSEKPPRSPDIEKWFNNGGIIKVGEKDGKQVWTYIDSEKREVSYVDGYPVFPLEAKHPVIGDISIGKFTGDREKDKKIYLERLEEQYGLTDIPDGYDLHHDSENGNMQLVKSDWHKEFRHEGGHKKFKEVE